MCFFSKSSRYLVSVNPVANLLRISAVPAVFSVSSVFHQVYEVFYSCIEQCRLLHTFSGSKFPTQFLNFSSNFKNPAYKFQISAQISKLNFWYRRRNFTALLTPRPEGSKFRHISSEFRCVVSAALALRIPWLR